MDRLRELVEAGEIGSLALRVFERASVPGRIEMLPYAWANDDTWKDRVMRPDPEGWGGHGERTRVGIARRDARFSSSSSVTAASPQEAGQMWKSSRL